MLQVIQDFKSGKLSVEEVPPPLLMEEGVLVANLFSLISIGTERRTVRTARANLLEKARQRPDLVRKVTANIAKEGLVGTYKKVRTRMEIQKPMGYSSVGKVVSSSCSDFQPGDLVACAGGGYASHAEIIAVPKNLVCRVPGGVDADVAAFTTLGAVAMQGVRQGGVSLGENIAIIGLGLVGRLASQICRAAGASTLGFDISREQLALARLDLNETCLIDSPDLLSCVSAFTDDVGMDAVLICADTRSKQPIDVAGEIARDRGRVVLVGFVDTGFAQDIYYEKELEIKLSRSYGPGRYDSNYEQRGFDYPIGYVRWTLNRNMKAFLQLIQREKVTIRHMIDGVYEIKDAEAAYERVIQPKTPAPALLLKYSGRPQTEIKRYSTTVSVRRSSRHTEGMRVGFVGAGNFAQLHLLPVLKKMDKVELAGVCTAHGVTGRTVANKYGFEFFTTSVEDILEMPDIGTVFIATRHNLHEELVRKSLRAGKAVFVEKPLCISFEELERITEDLELYGGPLMVGFNRRFSPFVKRVKGFFPRKTPLSLTYRINAGPIQKGHWYGDAEHGGRILGEIGHFVDLAGHIIDAPVTEVYATCLRGSAASKAAQDTASVQLVYGNGALATINYVSEGSTVLSKERIEIFGANRAAVLGDFRRLTLYGDRKKKFRRSVSKGHREELRETVRAFGQGTSPIPFEEIYEATLVSLQVMDSIRDGIPYKPQLKWSRE